MKPLRATPRIGTKVWFAPRRFGGWGWEPVSVEGWLVTIGFVLLTVVPIAFLDEDGSPWPYLLVVGIAVAATLAACALKGTSPGGKAAAAEYRRATRSG